MTPAARKYLEDNSTWNNGDPCITPPIQLRCDIAMAAMQGMISSRAAGEDWPLPTEVAKLAVVYADWLLTELAKT